MNYLPIPKYLELKQSPIHGMGIFTKELIKNKTFNYNVPLELVTHYAIKNGESWHLIRTPLGGFLNHSATPNCTLQDGIPPFNEEALKAYLIKPLRDIAAGEELTLDYSKELCGLHDYDDSFIKKEPSIYDFFESSDITPLDSFDMKTITNLLREAWKDVPELNLNEEQIKLVNDYISTEYDKKLMEENTNTMLYGSEEE